MIETTLYSTGWIPDTIRKIPRLSTAEAIATFFQANYPEINDKETRIKDVARYQTEDILEQIRQGQLWLVARINSRLVGITKFRIDNRSDNSNQEETKLLISWMMIALQHRRKGIATNFVDQIDTHAPSLRFSDVVLYH